jgi:hypothetical protein
MMMMSHYFFAGRELLDLVLPAGKTAAAGRLKRSVIAPPPASVLSWLDRLSAAR